jgi:hypothetical protein
MPDSNVSTDVKWELTILEVVHGFYLELLRKALEDDVIVPSCLSADSLRAPADPEKTLADFRRWLKLLDLAIAPALIREALNTNIDQDTAEALLRYYVRKKSHTNFDRDKTDFATTYLYRNPRVKGQWESRGYSMDGVAPIPPFEIALLEILQDSELPTLGPEHARALDEFEFLRQEADDFRTFDALMDSGIIQRVREIKNSFDAALYHPHVLSVIASYNAFFADKFDELFKAAAAHIKNFAEQAQQKGASIHASVQGNITVKHLTEIQEDDILAGEYVHAQEQFRHVSDLKKAVDSRSAAQRTPSPVYGSPEVPPLPPVPPPVLGPSAPGAAPVPQSQKPLRPVSPAPAFGQHDLQLNPSLTPPSSNKRVEEENRLASVEESVRSFVTTADPRYRSVIPMGFGNLVLTASEADAYCADYARESSFRGDNVRVLKRIPALIARMTSEIGQIERQQDLKYLWRPHAESLMLLLFICDEVEKKASELTQLSTQRGLTDKVSALNASLQKLKAKSGQAKSLLAMMNARE